jgi:hypothetical protein
MQFDDEVTLRGSQLMEKCFKRQMIIAVVVCSKSLASQAQDTEII